MRIARRRRPLKKLRLTVTRAGCRVLGALFPDRAVPLAAILGLRRLGGSRDALLPAGAWAIGPAELDFLGRRLRRLVPMSVLEFGCGDSTIYMARVLAEVHGDDKTHVISVEQDAAFADECRRRLAAERLSAVVVSCRLVNRPVPDGKTLTYDLSPEFLAGILPAGGPDLVVIDGPSGGCMVRYPILPLVQPYLNAETPFLLHDGLRDYELRVASMWRHLPGIVISGVHVIEEGFVSGTVKPLKLDI
jgi:hypothetical protein